MSSHSLFWSLTAFIGLAATVWYGAYRWSGMFTKSAPPAGEVGANGSWCHDPDTAFAGRLSYRVAVAGSAAAACVYLLLVMAITWAFARIELGVIPAVPLVTPRPFQALPAEFYKLGVDRDRTEMLEWLRMSLNQESIGAATNQFVDGTILTNLLSGFFTTQEKPVIDNDVKMRAAKLAQAEAAGKSAFESFVSMLGSDVSISGDTMEADRTKPMEEFAALAYPGFWNPAMPGFEAWMNKGANLGSDSASRTPVLEEVRQRLEEQFSEKPSVRLFSQSLYEKVRAAVGKHTRVRAMAVGKIQWLTFVLFFFGLIVLGVRKSNLDRQYRFDELPTSEAIRRKMLNERLLRAPSEQGTDDQSLIRHFGDPDEISLHQEICFVEACGREASGNLFSIGILRRILQELYDRMRGGRGVERLTEAKKEALLSLSQTIERVENRLERVEYVPLDFVIYGMPSIGFIGTVLGIGMSLGNADQVVKAADAAGQAAAITGVTAYLGIAFDTTLVALVCGILIMLLLYWIRSAESKFILEIQEKITTRTLRL